VADDSVVAMKFLPMKAGNSLEDKTEITFDKSRDSESSKEIQEVQRDEVILEK
jgi:hypothetical protein